VNNWVHIVFVLALMDVAISVRCHWGYTDAWTRGWIICGRAKVTSGLVIVRDVTANL